MVSYTVDLEPVGRRCKCRADETILDCARRFGVGINSICGGRGECRSCKVRVLNGAVTKPTPNEIETFSQKELRAGWHLACQTSPRGNCKINVPAGSMTTSQRLQIEGLDVTVPSNPPVMAYYVKLRPPSLSDQQPDAERMQEELKAQHRLHCTDIDIDTLRMLSTRLRAWDWECQAVVRNDEVIAVAPWPSRQLGIAIDLGTTKIAGYLVDLASGNTLASKGIMNPQIGYGEDIISRITAAVRSQEKKRQLRRLVTDEVNRLAFELCSEVKSPIEEILEAVIVGNTVMHHLFLGLPAGQIALSPFVSTVNKSLDVKARDLGLRFAAGAYVHLLPNIAGFIGSDHVAMLLSTDAWSSKGPIIVLDIGTNTEVSLINNGKISSVSCASGPAFEGGHIKDGMRAAMGAIERLRFSDGDIQYQTIGNVPPVGICGSGILDSMSQLFLSGIIDESGRMHNYSSHVRIDKDNREFVLVDKNEHGDQQPITITQLDIRELQLAKAAIRSGIQVLLEDEGCAEDEIMRVIIAGAFGNYIDVTSAIAIGMLPSVPLDRFIQVGNAAGMGAKLALISLSKRNAARAIAPLVNYIELATAPGFNKTFRQACYLGRYRITNGERTKIK